MVEKTDKIWMDGDFVDWDDAKVHILTHTLHYGVGVFEGIRCYKCSEKSSAIFRLDEHIDRIFNGIKILKMPISFTKQEIIDACIEMVKINKLDECYIRPIFYCGTGGMGIYAQNPTQASIIVWPWGSYLGEGALENGIRAKVSSFNRHHVNIDMVQGKIIGQYISSILAKKEVAASGYDEAIMLDINGYVAEGTGENIFVIRDGIIITPPTSSPILNGITRKSVIEIAQNMKYEVKEEAFTRDFMYLCEEAFFTGTAAEITPIREIDDRKIGNGEPGPITKKIQKEYFEIVRGKSRKYKKWLTYI